MAASPSRMIAVRWSAPDEAAWLMAQTVQSWRKF